MTQKGYNGWTNYETWAVALWIDNEQESYNYWRDTANKIDNAGKLASMLKEHFEEESPDLGASMFSDLLGAAMGEVNWYEIATHMGEE